MKRFLVALYLLVAGSVQAATYYVTQAGAGLGNGSTLGNAASVATLNGHTSEGDDVIILNGTLTTAITCHNSGTSGHPITYLFASGAKMSSPAWNSSGAINTNQLNYLVIDGGTNGIIENTENGSALATQLSTVGILCTLSHDVEIKNLTIQNLYVHSSLLDNYDLNLNGCIYAQGPGNNLSIHNCVFSHMGRQINLLMAYAACSGLSIYANDFGHCSIGINIGVGQALTTCNVYSNSFHDYADWDSTANAFHTNGVHIYASAAVSGFNFYNNLFHGYGGGHRTSELIYMEIDAAGGSYDSCNVYNNLALQSTDNFGNFGIICLGGGYGTFTNTLVANNTLIGNGSTYGILTNRGTPVFVNNVFKNHFYAVSFYGSAPTGTFDYNFYTGNTHFGTAGSSDYDTLSAWQAILSGEVHAVSNATSGVNTDGTLAAGSPAIDVGVSEASHFTTDYISTTRPQGSAWDIGAYEYVTPAPATAGRRAAQGGTQPGVGL